MLSLHKLEIFNTVAMEGSFSAAAERLLLTQPAVSQHIRDLESSLGTGLFVRSNRGVRLTPAGETLLDYTRCILRMLAEAESAVTNLNQMTGGQLAVGATPGAGVYLLPEWIGSFQRRFPGLTVSLKTDTTHAIAAEILSGRLDLGLVEGELLAEPAVEVLELRPIHLVVVVGPQHPWWEWQTAPVTALNGQPFIARPHGSQTRAWTDQIFSQHGISPRIVAEFDHPEVIKQAVASGMGITILPDWGISEETGSKVHALEMEGVDLRRTLKLLWSEARPPKPSARAFLAHLADRFPQLARFVTSSGEIDPRLPPLEAYRAILNCKDR